MSYKEKNVTPPFVVALRPVYFIKHCYNIQKKNQHTSSHNVRRYLRVVDSFVIIWHCHTLTLPWFRLWSSILSRHFRFLIHFFLNRRWSGLPFSLSRYVIRPADTPSWCIGLVGFLDTAIHIWIPPLTLYTYIVTSGRLVCVRYQR